MLTNTKFSLDKTMATDSWREQEIRLQPCQIRNRCSRPYWYLIQGKQPMPPARSQHSLTTTTPHRLRRRVRKSSQEPYHHHQRPRILVATRRDCSKVIVMPSAMTSYLMLCLLLTIVTVLKLSTALVIPSNAGNVSPKQQQRPLRHSLRLNVMTDREADFVEQMVGGERYSMIPLPDSMTDTTLFVGNLCEFVSDDDLSRLFQTVSALHSLPACVARKPNTQSLEYGFVAFPTIAEKEVSSESYWSE